MADAVSLVKEALKSGKTEQEVISLMKQAGYTDEAVSEMMAEVKNRSGDELTRKIVEKNRIPLTQAAPKQAVAQQQPTMQPMPAPKFKKTYKIILTGLGIATGVILVLWFLFPQFFAI